MRERNLKKLNKDSLKRAFLIMAGVIELTAAVVGGALIGMYLGSKTGKSGLFIGIFTLLGFAGGTYNMFKILNRKNKND